MTYRPAHMTSGVFMAPLHHRIGVNPSVAYERDLEFIRQLDLLGYDEAWIGEHHSGGIEIIADPMLFIAAASRETRRIRLGAGVVDLPLHHPFMVADRMTMLDHLTRGRAMLGVGTGALIADTRMIGVDLETKRQRSAEALEAIMALLRADAPVTMKTPWFELVDARLQLGPFTKPHLPVAVAGAASVDGSSSSGRYGIGLLTGARRVEALGKTWAWVQDAAAKHGQTVTRDEWRVMKFYHLAETRQQALDDVRHGLRHFHSLHLLAVTPDEVDDPHLAEKVVERGAACIGTPEDAVEDINRMLEASGGFGGVLQAVYFMAAPDRTLRSYDLWAREVAPRFQGAYDAAWDHREWVIASGGGSLNGAVYGRGTSRRDQPEG